MSRFNLHSLLFAVVVLIMVSIGERSTHDAPRIPTTTIATKTSLADAGSSFPSDSVANPPVQEIYTPRIENGNVAVAPFEKKFPRDEFLITAQSVLVREVLSNTPIYAAYSEETWPLASITKLITALVAKDIFPKDTLIGMTDDAILTPGISGFFKPGEIFLVEDVIKAALGVSSNDAAAALAGAAGHDAFLEAMRLKARDIGMSRTSFFDSTGLSSLNLSTADDLGKLGEYMALNEGNLLAITRTPVILIREQSDGNVRELINNNQFAGQSWFIGGKTGYTDDANGNLLTIASFEGRAFIVVLLGSNDRFSETKTILHWIESEYL